MKKGLWITVLLFLAVTLAGCFALTKPEASSGTVVAPTLAPVETVNSVSEPTEAPTTEASSAPTQEASTAVTPAEAGSATIYEIDLSRSKATFTIKEVLRGSDKTVVGTSTNLAGQISLDMNDPTAAQVGEILIDARNFVTDNDFRNRAIANEILLTNANQYITFQPKKLVGLPDSVTIGQTYNFQIVGDLTIIGETHEETFDATVTLTSETEIQGQASVTISYGDFGVTVPLSQVVTAVEKTVLLEIDFVAVAQ